MLAYREGILPRQPYVSRLREAPPQEGYWEPQQMRQLVGALPEWLVDVAWFGYLTGCRRGELLQLEWRSVDLTARTAHFRPEKTKTGRGRMLALEGPLWEIIQRREVARHPAPWVFHRDGRVIARWWFDRAWQRACAALGNAGKLFKDFRRTAVRNMIRAGVPERITMEISGHKTRSMLDRYNIVNDADMRLAINTTTAYLQRTEAIVRPLRREEETG